MEMIWVTGSGHKALLSSMSCGIVPSCIIQNPDGLGGGATLDVCLGSSRVTDLESAPDEHARF